MQMALNNLQIEFADIDDNYREFVNKFKPKKTTDDCYTPDNVFEAVKNWCIAEYGLDAEKILRPFWPGGDYERMEYPDGCTVIDNPPFSILTQICRKYLREGIRFFLFAPTLTNFSIGGGAPGVCHIITNSDITYENGAVVNTSFVTNLDENLIRTAPTLHAAIEREDKINRQKDKTILPKYDYPPEALTSSMCAYIATRGIELTIGKDEAVFIRALSSQRAVKKAMFGGGLPHEHSSIESKGSGGEGSGGEGSGGEGSGGEGSGGEGSGGEGSGGSLASVQSGESRDRIHGQKSRRERRAG